MYSLSSGLGTVHDLDGITVNKKLENETYEFFYNSGLPKTSWTIAHLAHQIPTPSMLRCAASPEK